MIDPGTNIQGETVQAYCERRWGSDGWTQRLKQEGRKDGARFGNWKYWPHTMKAHQLVLYCETNGLSTDKCNALLFDAEYEQGENLSDVDALVRIAETMEIEDMSELRRYLSDDEARNAVQAEIQAGRRKYGISSVPFFVVAEAQSSTPYGFSGAQGSETFLELFEELS
mmetsp:Transcript_27742/g.77752  ORF Transcript_27742/g.77752 Transcript_27742/m.77752 type:complete len:169 (-) Transcript_27742:266-772(-)